MRHHQHRGATSRDPAIRPATHGCRARAPPGRGATLRMFPSYPPTEEDTMMLRTSAALAVLLLAPVSALARNVHFVGTPTCTASGSQLCCSGKLAGLGTAPTSVQVLANFTCTNRGGNNPPGQASGQSAPIQPSG